MKKVCVIGWPINHSRSPIIHNYWLKKYSISGSYEKLAVPSSDLENFLTTMQKSGFCGCNVTIPYKEQAFALIDVVDSLSIKIGAINTIYYKDGMQYGLNTDGFGFISNLSQNLPGWFAKGKICVIVGAGGAARAILAVLLSEGAAKIIIVNRTISRAQDLAIEFGVKVFASGLDDLDRNLPEADLLINTTSLGMEGQPALNIDINLLSKNCVVTDIVYSPLMTDLLLSAQSAGRPIVDGLGMLLYQAVPGFEKWFGVRPLVTHELRQLVIENLSEG